ncbi:MAG: HDOD domain-containing protein [Candidatus Hinthialibacter antarcticus]|nr:HDOD domain-containing protein [Candidatus Hinthialibacter antarcticus]
MNLNLDFSNSNHRIPDMTSSASRLLSLLQMPQVDPGEVVHEIEANSLAHQYALRVARALQPAGDADGQSLLSVMEAYSPYECLEWALAGALQPMLMPDEDNDVLSDLYLHSLATAFCALLLAKECKCQAPRFLFLSGLMHDVGLAVLVRNLGIDFNTTVELAAEEVISIDEAERKRLGCDHGEVGAECVSNWSGIQAMIDVAKYHHRPDQYEGPHQRILDLVHVADTLSRMVGIGIGNEGLAFHTSVDAKKRISYTPEVEENVVYFLLAGMEVLHEEIC